jgi:hypothetical protein
MSDCDRCKKLLEHLVLATTRLKEARERIAYFERPRPGIQEFMETPPVRRSVDD